MLVVLVVGTPSGAYFVKVRFWFQLFAVWKSGKELFFTIPSRMSWRFCSIERLALQIAGSTGQLVVRLSAGLGGSE
jgi:hypothetical protein